MLNTCSAARLRDRGAIAILACICWHGGGRGRTARVRQQAPTFIMDGRADGCHWLMDVDVESKSKCVKPPSWCSFTAHVVISRIVDVGISPLVYDAYCMTCNFVGVNVAIGLNVEAMYQTRTVGVQLNIVPIGSMLRRGGSSQ